MVPPPSGGGTSTISASLRTAWHVLKVEGYSQIKGMLGIGKHRFQHLWHWRLYLVHRMLAWWFGRWKCRVDFRRSCSFESCYYRWLALSSWCSLGQPGWSRCDVQCQWWAIHGAQNRSRCSVPGFHGTTLWPSHREVCESCTNRRHGSKGVQGLSQFHLHRLSAEIEEGERVLMAQHLLVAADRPVQHGETEIHLCWHAKQTRGHKPCGDYTSPDSLKGECFKFLISPGNLTAAMASEGFRHLNCSCPSLLEELLAKVAPWPWLSLEDVICYPPRDDYRYPYLANI